jgi:hypothetical protein
MFNSVVERDKVTVRESLSRHQPCGECGTRATQRPPIHSSCRAWPAACQSVTVYEETRCSNSARRANTATSLCHQTHVKRAFARTNARSVHRVWRTSSATSARTAAARSCPGQSGRRRTGRTTTFSAKTLQAHGLGTDPLTPSRTRSSRPQSRTFHRRGGSARQRISRGQGVTRRVTRYIKGLLRSSRVKSVSWLHRMSFETSQH